MDYSHWVVFFCVAGCLAVIGWSLDRANQKIDYIIGEISKPEPSEFRCAVCNRDCGNDPVPPMLVTTPVEMVLPHRQLTARFCVCYLCEGVKDAAPVDPHAVR